MNRTLNVLNIFKKIAAVLWWGATILLVVAIVYIMGAKIKGEVPFFCGYSVMNIISGSMEDTIPEGSYILIKKTDATEIRKGDIICFYSDDPAIRGYPNTHTVVEDPIYGENGIEFVTKGDANPQKDTHTAKGDKLIGKYVLNLNMLTDFSKMLEGKGILIISTVLVGLCAAIMVASVFLNTSMKDSDDASEAQKQDAKKDQNGIDTPQV